MKIKLAKNTDQVELIKAMASKDKAVAMQAREAFAAFVGPVVAKVLNVAGTAPLIYTDFEYDEDDQPSLPVDPYRATYEGAITVWSQSTAGGLPSTQVIGGEEMKFGDYELDSAVHWLEKYARKARLDVVSKAMNFMAQQILIKQERNAWAVVLKALAEGSSNGLEHVIQTTAANVLQLDDFNRLLTRARRVNTAWNAGTPESDTGRGVTDMFLSPEAMEQIRGFAYQPMNTRTVDGTAGTPAGSSTAMPLPDSVRERIFNAGGAQEIYGIGLVQLNELGINQKYNTLFDNFYGGALTFATANQEILIAIDQNRETIHRGIAIGEDGGSVKVSSDDSFVSRSGKVGFYAKLKEARLVSDSRACLGCIIQ